MSKKDIQNKTEQELELEQEKLKKKRAYWIEHNRRAQKRRKLKLEVAEFCNQLQTRKGLSLDRKTIININSKLNLILNLPYRWTDKDYQRSKRMLVNLKNEVLQSNYKDVPPNQRAMIENFSNTMTEANLDMETRINIVLNLLKDEVTELFLHKADSVEPSPEMALLFLTQNMQFNVPKWFHKEVVKLIYSKFSQKEYIDFLKELRSAIIKRDMLTNKEKYAKEIHEQSLRECVGEGEMLIDINQLLKK